MPVLDAPTADLNAKMSVGHWSDSFHSRAIHTNGAATMQTST